MPQIRHMRLFFMVHQQLQVMLVLIVLGSHGTCMVLDRLIGMPGCTADLPSWV